MKCKIHLQGHTIIACQICQGAVCKLFFRADEATDEHEVFGEQVRINLAEMDGSSASAVSVLADVPMDQLAEYGGVEIEKEEDVQDGQNRPVESSIVSRGLFL